MKILPLLMRTTGLAAALGLAACATPYKPYSFWHDGGYTETEVQPGLFVVQFVGNGKTELSRSTDFALLRAADICLARGQEFMFVGDLATQNAQHVWVPAPTTSVEHDSSGAAHVSVHNGSPSVSYNPSTGVTVSCADAKLPGAWDANYLARTIRAKYSMT